MSSIRHIAKLAGVSPMTVSYALRNDPKISLRTREKIQNIAKSEGYTRNALVSRVMAQFTSGRKSGHLGTIAFINSFKNRSDWNYWYTRRKFYEGIVARAQEWNYQVEEYYFKAAGMTSTRLSRILKKRGIQGLVIGNLPKSVGHLSLTWNWFSSVTQGFSLVKPNLHRVCTDFAANMFIVLRNLKRLGYRKVGFVQTHTSIVLNRTIYSSIYSHNAGNFFQEVVPTLVVPNFDDSSVVGWYRKYQPEVIISVNHHALNKLLKNGVRVPEDVGFVNLSLEDQGRKAAGIDIQSEVLGAAAVDLVISMLQSKNTGIPDHPHTVLVAGKWHKGTTLKSK